MWARLTRIPGLPPERIDDVVKMFEEQELPMIEQHEGFQGITVMVDPDLGTAAALSLWDTQQHMRDSEKQAQASREQVIQETGDQPGPRRDLIVERLEVKLQR
jgi:heme-degrading monooxygenase HmoA